MEGQSLHLTGLFWRVSACVCQRKRCRVCYMVHFGPTISVSFASPSAPRPSGGGPAWILQMAEKGQGVRSLITLDNRKARSPINTPKIMVRQMPYCTYQDKASLLLNRGATCSNEKTHNATFGRHGGLRHLAGDH